MADLTPRSRFHLLRSAWHQINLNRLQQKIRPRQMAIVEAGLIGVISGLAAVCLKQGVGLLGSGRLQMATLYPDWLILPLIGGLGGFLAGYTIERFAPEAAGSGIPQVKAALGYIPITLNARVALVKLASTLISLGSGLTLGRQGPTVQIGAAIAGQLSQWLPTSPDHRRQLLAAGAAAGLAAGFNAPIAGVLFVIEELLQDVSGLTLGTAILASFIGAVVSRVLGGEEIPLTPNLMDIYPYFSVSTIPLLMLLGAIAGVLGIGLIRGLLLGLRLNRRLRLGLPWRVGLAGLISGALVAALPIMLRNNASLQSVWITSEFSWQMLLLIFIAKFALTLIAFSSGAPGGLFAPSLVLGSALGYLVIYGALGLQNSLGIPLGVDTGVSYTTTFALAGMAAFFSAVTRGPITAIVIVFEMTTDFDLVLPLMIASVSSYLVAEAISSGSIYKYVLAWNGIHIKPLQQMESRLAGLTAADIMQRRVETLSSQMSLTEVTQAFARSHHRGFPVVDEGQLVGIVTQTDLAKINQQKLEESLPLSTIMTSQPVTVRPHDPLPQVLFWLDRYKLSRLPVVDRYKLVGIITRADIIRAETDRLSGKTEAVGPQPEPSYVVYQTRDPAVGQGRLLVPIANPKTAGPLLQMAAAIAKSRRYELECLQVIPVSRLRSPAETAVSTATSRRLLKQTNQLRREWQIPIHTQIRVTHDVSQAILEAIQKRHIDMVLMGWKGVTDTPDRIFGSVVDTIIRQADCRVILVKFPLQNSQFQVPAFDRWLVPTAGGGNSQDAIQLLPFLVKLSEQPEIRLCYVSRPQQSIGSFPGLDKQTNYLKSRTSAAVIPVTVCSDSVSDAIVDLADKNQCDVIMLGATREGLLQQVISGNIPEEIARRSNCTVILVRSAI